MSAQFEVQLLAVLVAVTCAIIGVFLVLRRMAMISDAISHTMLFGIVIGFLITKDTSSPLLLLGATLTGVLTVWLVELLNNTKKVKEDSAIGLVFPLLFSIAVLLISRYASNAHIDQHSVLLGELAFAPFDRLTFLGLELPRGIWVISGILLLNLLFIGVFYKELKLTTFDAGLALTLGFSPAILHYGLMTLVSLTAVGSFDAVGAILVVALMIGPPSAAYLLTDRLPTMIGLSALIGSLSALAGYWMSYWLDTTISGSMAVMVGVSFGLVFLFAPKRGLIAVQSRQERQRWEFAQQMLTTHLLNHEGEPDSESESNVRHLREHMHWQDSFANRVVHLAERQGLIQQVGEQLQLTELGRKHAQQI
jgi:manganese/zinc/iron transport system permease protein